MKRLERVIAAFLKIRPDLKLALYDKAIAEAARPSALYQFMRENMPPGIVLFGMRREKKDGSV